MKTGVAVGYDWLYHDMPSETRETINAALIARTLRLSQRNFNQGLWWTEDIYNWNLVSHGQQSTLSDDGWGIDLHRTP